MSIEDHVEIQPRAANKAMTAVKKLAEIGSQALSTQPAGVLRDAFRERSDLDDTDGLQRLLDQRNGFVAFEGALVVFPTASSPALPGILEWNIRDGWRRYYADIVPDNAIFFAEDAFAGQFATGMGGVIRLDPETGVISEHSASIEDWAAKVLANYDYETGWSVAREWQLRNGRLPVGYRLLGKKPFVLGGDYVPENLVLVEGKNAMEKLGRLYQQIRDLPDGQQITVSGWL